MVSLPARSAGKIGPFCTICRVPARSAGKIWAFYSVSGEIPARSAGKFWAICVASVKFCSLARAPLLLGDEPHDEPFVVGETRPATLLVADPPTASAATAEGASQLLRARGSFGQRVLRAGCSTCPD